MLVLIERWVYLIRTWHEAKRLSIGIDAITIIFILATSTSCQTQIRLFLAGIPLMCL
jgi:hypothetical protein